MTSRLTRVLIIAAVAAFGRTATAQETPTATLAGFVRDSAGSPVPSAEILLLETTYATRSDSAGHFVLSNIPPGAYRVWFRRLGFGSSQFDWSARSGERTEVAVVLHAIARTLDPVVVRAQEDKDMAARASLLGLVIDTDGQPIDEAEVQLVGVNRSGVTRANGGFLFRPLPIGAYVVRVRKLGFEPHVVKLNLVAGDDREIVIRMRRLAANLDPVVVTARSGYDPRDQQVFDDLDRRKRWHNFKSAILGPEDLRRFYGLSLDLAVKSLLMDRPQGHGYPVNSIMGGNRAARPSRLDTLDRDACILLNGKTPVRRPLRVYSTDDIDLLEVYPSGTEVTGTIEARMTARECKAISIFNHPTYYVLWLKGNSR
jgi:hypothetical protein